MDDRAVPHQDGTWRRLLVQECHFNYSSVATYAQLKKYRSKFCPLYDLMAKRLLFQPTILIPYYLTLTRTEDKKYTSKEWSHDKDISHIKDPNPNFMFTQQRTRIYVSSIIILFDLNVTQYFVNHFINYIMDSLKLHITQLIITQVCGVKSSLTIHVYITYNLIFIL